MQSIPSRRVSCASLLVSGFLASGAWGCASLPKTGIESTGEPLNVEVRTETHTYTTQAKVGEVVSRDSSGRVIGTSEVYENRTGTYDVTRWQVFQGDTPIDDQDFFRIGGDIASAKEIAASRQSGVTMNKVGIGLLIGGGALALAGIILGPALTTTDSNGIETSPSWTPYLMTGGLLTVSVGGVLTWIGIAKVKREHPIDDPARANAVAKKYNASLGSGSAPVADEDEEDEPPPPPKKKKKKKK
ncbi:MAG: hypothetical protein IPM54_02120 [Polyangiaceae bacterium]|nr:hypothetical protein [Polyangiaceae bacterium]